MTNIVERCVHCGVCRRKSDQRVILSAIAGFGSPGLDGRPPRTPHVTMDLWLQVCPHCGFCSSDLTEASRRARKVVRSREYKTITEHDQLPAMAVPFVRRAMIDQELDDPEAVAQSYVWAAWACDDATEDPYAEAYARDFRSRAAEFMDAALEQDQWDQSTYQDQRVRQIDLLRRAGELEKARQYIGNIRNQIDKPTLVSIMEYQSQLLSRGVRAARTIDDAVRAVPPVDKRDELAKNGPRPDLKVDLTPQYKKPVKGELVFHLPKRIMNTEYRGWSMEEIVQQRFSESYEALPESTEKGFADWWERRWRSELDRRYRGRRRPPIPSFREEGACEKLVQLEVKNGKLVKGPYFKQFATPWWLELKEGLIGKIQRILKRGS